MAARPRARASVNPVPSQAAVDVGARREIAWFASYPEAEAAVDALADEQFPVERLAIVAEGLRYIEDVTGRRGYSQAAFEGVVTGAVVGALLGFFFGLFDWVEPVVTGLALALYGALIGAIAGAALGALTHWLSAGRRDFSSVAGIQAERYVVICDAERAEEGSRRLQAAMRRR